MVIVECRGGKVTSAILNGFGKYEEWDARHYSLSLIEPKVGFTLYWIPWKVSLR